MQFEVLTVDAGATFADLRDKIGSAQAFIYYAQDIKKVSKARLRCGADYGRRNSEAVDGRYPRRDLARNGCSFLRWSFNQLRQKDRWEHLKPALLWDRIYITRLDLRPWERQHQTDSELKWVRPSREREREARLGQTVRRLNVLSMELYGESESKPTLSHGLCEVRRLWSWAK